MKSEKELKKEDRGSVDYRVLKINNAKGIQGNILYKVGQAKIFVSSNSVKH